MNLSSGICRDYQIAELTRGTKLPIPALQQRHMLVISELLIAAWNGLLKNHESIIRSKDEPEVNALMNSRLNKIRLKKPEWSLLVLGVTRGAESISYDGRSLEKRPDLSIFITNRLFSFPLIVECKLIDKKEQKGVELYCNKGISRFISGEYAWYAQEAFMLAYVRDGATIASSLTPQLKRCKKSVPDPFLTEQIPEALRPSFPNLAKSRHGRLFPQNPGSIFIWHLWLS